MSNYFRFGEKSSQDFDMHIEKYPTIKGATRKRTTVSVAGRNGDIHLDEDAFTNYKQSYECYFHGNLPTPEQAHAIKAWLTASGDYLRLEDTYDSAHFRLAAYIGPLDVQNYFNEFGRCTVTFDCAPQWFLKSGEYPVEFTKAGTILNPTSKIALPLITVFGTGSGAVKVGNISVTIKAIDGCVILDCDSEDAYSLADDGEKVNENEHIYAQDFPVLVSGENSISFSGGITKVEIIPRWWEV